MQSKYYSILRQECPSQRIRDHIETDTQIACRLQAEEQGKEKYQNCQEVRYMNRDCVNQSAEAPHMQNRQHPAL